MTLTLAEKNDDLRRLVAQYGSLAVAFSGGVDSTFLAAVASKVLGDRVLLLNARSPSFPEDEAVFVQKFAVDYGLELRVVSTNELEIEE